MTRWSWLVTVIFAVACGPAFAQGPPSLFGNEPVAAPIPKPDLRLPGRPDASSTTSAKSRSAPPTASLWGTVAALGVMALGLFLAVRFLQRHGPPSLRGLPADAVEPLGQRALSRGVAVHLVRCGSRMLLLGVGPDGIRTLSEITDPVEVDLLVGACRRRDEGSTGVAAFAQVWQRTAATPTSAPATHRPSRTVSAFPMSSQEVDGV